MNADDAYRHIEQVDAAATIICELGVVLFLVLALVAAICTSRIYYRFGRRIVRKWRAVPVAARESLPYRLKP